MKKNLIFAAELVFLFLLPLTAAAQKIGGAIPGDAGSGVINSGTGGEITYYGSTGTTVSGSSALYQSATGSIGIGTTTPATVLDVDGDITMETGTAGAVLCLTSAHALGHCTGSSSCLTTCTCTCAAN